MMKKAWTTRFVGASVLLLMVSGCGIFDTVSGEPERARLTVDQSDTPSVELSISLNFLVTEGNNISFQELNVDTVSVPFNQEYDIRNHLRFYVQATNVETEDITFRMKVMIDAKTFYNEQKTLEPGETAQFLYRYQAPNIY